MAPETFLHLLILINSTYLLPVMPPGTQGSNKISPLAAVFSQPTQLSPSLSSIPHFQFHCSLPCNLWSSWCLLPSGIQYSAILAKDSSSCWSTCPIHVHLCFIIVCDIGRLPHFCRSTLFVIVSGQKIFMILQRVLVWKVLTLHAPVSVIFQHSLP